MRHLKLRSLQEFEAKRDVLAVLIADAETVVRPEQGSI